MRQFFAAIILIFLAAPRAQAADRKVHPGRAYGSAIFTGMAVGALAGAAAGAVPYATERKNQDPDGIIKGLIYGAIGGAIGLGTPSAAYEVGSDKVGASKRILFNTFSFAMIGGVVGGMGGVISYRRKIGYDEKSAEDFLGAAAGGVLAGGLIGLGVGVFEGVFWDESGGERVPGRGIHAKWGMVELASLHDGPEGLVDLPNVTLARLEF